jgi:hypothetical protein
MKLYKHIGISKKNYLYFNEDNGASHGLENCINDNLIKCIGYWYQNKI